MLDSHDVILMPFVCVRQVVFALNQTLTQREHSRGVVTSSSTPASYSTDDLIQQYNCGRLDDILLRYSSNYARMRMRAGAVVAECADPSDAVTSVDVSTLTTAWRG